MVFFNKKDLFRKNTVASKSVLEMIQVAFFSTFLLSADYTSCDGFLPLRFNSLLKGFKPSNKPLIELNESKNQICIHFM